MVKIVLWFVFIPPRMEHSPSNPSTMRSDSGVNSLSWLSMTNPSYIVLAQRHAFNLSFIQAYLSLNGLLIPPASRQILTASH